MFIDDLVSIIMPAYNSEKYIAESIDSVMRQTYPNWELLITDDCSTDNTESIVSRLASKESRIHYFKLACNGGAAIARNNSIAHARGRFLAFLDADDVWRENKLVEHLSFMKKEEASFSFTGYAIYFGGGSFSRKVIDSQTPSSINYDDLLKKTCTVGCSTVLLDRSKLPEIKMHNIRTGQDYALWLSLLRETNGVALNYKANLSGYRISANSISRNKLRKARRQWQIYRDVEGIGLLNACIYMFYYARNAIFRK